MNVAIESANEYGDRPAEAFTLLDRMYYGIRRTDRRCQTMDMGRKHWEDRHLVY